MTAPVLVVGSYPPIPVAGSPVTLAEVRRAWGAGQEVTVVSPRLSAAHLVVPVFGPLAGRRLENVRRHTRARRVVMVVEPGYPFPAHPVAQVVTAAVLARALRAFEHVRLVQAGPPAGVSARAWSLLSQAADEVTVAPAGPVAAGVTPLGPREMARSERPRRLAATAARRLLGRRAPAVRAALGRARRQLHRRAAPGGARRGPGGR